MGVFFYVFIGVGSTANFFFGSVVGVAGLSSMFQIGCAYAIGILLAIIVCGPTSGGHFNPTVTVAMVLFRGFPKVKALRYIVAQILGGYIACLLVYVQWGISFTCEAMEVLEAAGKLEELMFTPSGPAGVFALYAPPGVNLGRIFLNEFVCDFLIGLVIWSILDPTNFHASPVAAPWIVAFVYGGAIWGYATVGIATNAARDVGARLMAMTIWGLPAGGGSYAAIAALTNFPATLLAVAFHEYVLSDSSRVITPASVDFLNGHIMHEEHRQGVVHGHATGGSAAGSSLDEKAHVEHV
ncbi:aquaporin-like protein [Daedaleopsis nitida]|nr:aquaporin-like protein [Daedaleopsis nitida]